MIESDDKGRYASRVRAFERIEPRVEKYNPPNGEAKVPGPYETPPPPSRRRRVKKPKQVRR